MVGGAYWFTHRNLQSTDDAFIDGDTVAVASRIAGVVERIFIADNQLVQAGDLMIELDPRDYQAALANAEAQLAQARAKEQTAQADLDYTRAATAASIEQAKSALAAAQSTLAQAKAQAAVEQAEALRAQGNLPRYENLAKQGAASRESLDQVVAAERSGTARWQAAQQAVQVANANIAEAQARVAQALTAPQQVAVKEADLVAARAQGAAAQAALDQARLNLSYTRIVAPATGHITRRSVNPGDVIEKNRVLATLVFGTPWVTANFKETELTRMRPGQSVEIEVDAYPDQRLKGHVDSIQRGTGAQFSLLPPENATGNYVKVVQRVPVKIVFDDPPMAELVLGLGMSVVPTVDLASEPPARTNATATAAVPATASSGSARQ